MSEKTLNFNNIRLNKKELSVKLDQIVVSDKFKHGNAGFKYFIGYQEGEIVKPLFMNGYINNFESFLIKDNKVWEKYEQI